MSLLGLLQHNAHHGQEAAEGAAAGGGAGGMIVGLILMVVIYAAMWKVFVKAGEPGWAAIVPIYNLITMLKIAGKPTWWVVLYLVPCVSLVIHVLVSIAIAEKFGKGTGFGIGLAFLSPIFFPMLGFGDAQYMAGKPAM